MCVLAAVPASASAQGGAESPAAPNAPPTAAAQHFVVGGGLDALLRDGSAFTPQLALHVGYQLRGGGVRVGASRVGLRLGLDYTGRNSGPRVLEVNGVPADTVQRSERSRIFGAVVLGTYALARGPVRPYVIGGAGLYRLSSAKTYAPQDLYNALTTPGYTPYPGGTVRSQRTSAALSGGFGVAAPLGRVALFGEARATYLPNGLGGNQPGVRGVALPLVVGVQF